MPKRFTLALVTIIILATSGITILVPLNKLQNLFAKSTQYTSQIGSLSNQYHLVVVYLILFLAICISYLILAKFQNQFSRTTTLFCLMVCAITFLLISQTYLPIYDPLYYHASIYAWLNSHVNPFVDLVSLYQVKELPIIGFPVLHNYPYGTLWLIYTRLIYQIAHSSFLTFIFFNQSVTLATIGISALLINRIKPTLHWTKTLLLLIINPIVILFLLPSGNPEALQGLFTLLSIHSLTKNKFSRAGTFSALATSLKLTNLPIQLLLFASVIRTPISIKLLITRTIKFWWPTIILLGLNLFWFHSPLPQINGLNQLLRMEQLQGLSAGSLLGHLLATITNTSWFLVSIPQILLATLVIIFTVLFLKVLSTSNYNLPALLKSMWTITLLTICLSGASPKPWYLYPVLLLSLLIGPKYFYTTTLITTLSLLGTSYLYLTNYFSNALQLVLLITAAIIANVVPLILIARSISPHAVTINS